MGERGGSVGRARDFSSRDQGLDSHSGRPLIVIIMVSVSITWLAERKVMVFLLCLCAAAPKNVIRQSRDPSAR